MSQTTTLQTSTFLTQNGQKIFYRYWKPATSPKRVVVIVHGLNSHSGYYQSIAEQLNGRQFAVCY